MRSKWAKLAGLIALGLVLAFVGRGVLDHALAMFPTHATTVERIGGWLIGLIVVLVVGVPMFKLFDVLDRKD